MESMWYLNMVDLKNRRITLFFALTYIQLIYKVLQVNWFLIIELYHLISKNQKLNFILSFIINI